MPEELGSKLAYRFCIHRHTYAHAHMNIQTHMLTKYQNKDDITPENMFSMQFINHFY